MPRKIIYTQTDLQALKDTSPAETYNIRLLLWWHRLPGNDIGKAPRGNKQHSRVLKGKRYGYKLNYSAKLKAHYIDIPLSVYMSANGPVKVANTATDNICGVTVTALTSAKAYDDNKSIAQDIATTAEMKSGQLLVLCYSLT